VGPPSCALHAVQLVELCATLVALLFRELLDLA
jgi:hypothetical protein